VQQLPDLAGAINTIVQKTPLPPLESAWRSSLDKNCAGYGECNGNVWEIPPLCLQPVQ
jgi:hypothetical protein